jgi:hypothetical protein
VDVTSSSGFTVELTDVLAPRHGELRLDYFLGRRRPELVIPHGAATADGVHLLPQGKKIHGWRWSIFYPHGDSIPANLKDPYGGEHRQAAASSSY